VTHPLEITDLVRSLCHSCATCYLLSACNRVCIDAGIVAGLIVIILKTPIFGTEIIGEALEWLFYVTLPNLCLDKVLRDLPTKHLHDSICSQIDEYGDRTTFCKQISQKNQTNPCCPGKLQNVIFRRRQ